MSILIIQMVMWWQNRKQNYLQFQIEEQEPLSSGQFYGPLPALADQPGNMPKTQINE